MGGIMTMNKKRTVETVKQELSDITQLIEDMIENGSKNHAKLDKLNTKQNDLEIELEFLTNIMGEK
jgi:hypothetical protein